ncbi:MAG: hypothetical protein BWX66_01369 [Deltaproteobacteria bacterium ADurb.Bin058]|nr:MAG: hypothetical protein BWX66_01369 [Deltaproteobacteria bacterium ADurb.Bin058]
MTAMALLMTFQLHCVRSSKASVLARPRFVGELLDGCLAAPTDTGNIIRQQRLAAMDSTTTAMEASTRGIQTRVRPAARGKASVLQLASTSVKPTAPAPSVMQRTFHLSRKPATERTTTAMALLIMVSQPWVKSATLVWENAKELEPMSVMQMATALCVMQ